MPSRRRAPVFHWLTCHYSHRFSLPNGAVKSARKRHVGQPAFRANTGDGIDAQQGARVGDAQESSPKERASVTMKSHDAARFTPLSADAFFYYY